MIKVFDFFCGCGGTSRGFADAGLDIAFGIDNDVDAGKTFRQNFPNAFFAHRDIRSFETEELTPIVGDRSKPLLFCGCAPCQPFSRQNRQHTISDPRRTLLAEFTRFIEAWTPEYVFVENVPGVQKIWNEEAPFHSFMAALDRLGYHFATKVIAAGAYGVPQTRERLVVLGSKLEPIDIPKATHGSPQTPFTRVIDWIGGLPPLKSGETNPQDPDHVAAALSPLNLKRIRATPSGGGRDTWPEELWLDCHKNHKGHTDVYGRLAWGKPAAGLTTRCISYSNGRFGHPEQHRALSIREAACLQTFPRKYSFVGSLGSRARQVGNAVPPLMARRIGEGIVRHFQETIF